mgnify:CR=1 FL=1
MNMPEQEKGATGGPNSGHTRNTTTASGQANRNANAADERREEEDVAEERINDNEDPELGRPGSGANERERGRHHSGDDARHGGNEGGRSGNL